MSSLGESMRSQNRLWWLLLAACLIAQPLLIDLHEFSHRACDTCTHEAPSEETFTGCGPSHPDHALAQNPAAAQGSRSNSSSEPTCGVLEEEATGSADSSPTDRAPHHHCQHCVLCYAAAHVSQSPPVAITIDPCMESVDAVSRSTAFRSSFASIEPCSPRAPPSLS